MVCGLHDHGLDHPLTLMALRTGTGTMHHAPDAPRQRTHDDAWPVGECRSADEHIIQYITAQCDGPGTSVSCIVYCWYWSLASVWISLSLLLLVAPAVVRLVAPLSATTRHLAPGTSSSAASSYPRCREAAITHVPVPALPRRPRPRPRPRHAGPLHPKRRRRPKRWRRPKR